MNEAKADPIPVQDAQNGERYGSQADAVPVMRATAVPAEVMAATAEPVASTQEYQHGYQDGFEAGKQAMKEFLLTRLEGVDLGMVKDGQALMFI